MEVSVEVEGEPEVEVKVEPEVEVGVEVDLVVEVDLEVEEPPVHQLDIKRDGVVRYCNPSRMIRDPTKAFEGPQAHELQIPTRLTGSDVEHSVPAPEATAASIGV